MPARQGLLIPGSAFGGIVYNISPLMERLNALTPFEAAVEEEEAEPKEPVLP